LQPSDTATELDPVVEWPTSKRLCDIAKKKYNKFTILPPLLTLSLLVHHFILHWNPVWVTYISTILAILSKPGVA
jgi:hypothetical protein